MPVPSPSVVDVGGGPTHIFDRWTQKHITVKKYIDDVSGVERLHAGNEYRSKIMDDGRECRVVLYCISRAPAT